MSKKIKVLIVDDSALVRQILTQGLSKDPEIEVVGTASDPYIARDKILTHQPDVVTLDVEMPRMDGVQFLKRLMPQHPIPVLMVSSLTERGKETTMQALEAGAIDFVTKPSSNIGQGLSAMLVELQNKVKLASRANVRHWKKANFEIRRLQKEGSHSLAESTDKVIAIGASTGGTEAIRHILQQLPADTPGIVVVQHMPPGFTNMFAKRLDQLSAMKVKEAVSGDRVLRGCVLIAPGDYHMCVKRSGGTYRVDCWQGDKVCGHRPSVDVLFRSVAEAAGVNALGVLLTGMGQDGAEGMLAMRREAAHTLAQDEKTSVVYGMPKVAKEIGGVEVVVPIQEMARSIIALLPEKN